MPREKGIEIKDCYTWPDGSMLEQ